ncbi:MAG: hypothetical protein ACM3RP_00495 [Chitinophagales bacterium]
MPTKMTWALILGSTLCAVAGQFSLKIATSKMGAVSVAGLKGFVVFALSALLNPLIFFGLSLYAIGAFLWIIVLSRVPLSFAYPFVALNFVLITLGSAFFLHEQVPANRLAGVALIVVGVLVASRR